MPNVFYPYYLEPWEPMRAHGEATIQRPIHVAMERAMPSVTDGEDTPADDVGGLKAIAKANDYVFGLPPHSAVYLQCPDAFDIIPTAKLGMRKEYRHVMTAVGDELRATVSFREIGMADSHADLDGFERCFGICRERLAELLEWNEPEEAEAVLEAADEAIRLAMADAKTKMRE